MIITAHTKTMQRDLSQNPTKHVSVRPRH